MIELLSFCTATFRKSLAKVTTTSLLPSRPQVCTVAVKTYETTDPTVDLQIVALQGSGANVLLTGAIPKFAAQAIRKVS